MNKKEYARRLKQAQKSLVDVLANDGPRIAKLIENNHDMGYVTGVMFTNVVANLSRAEFLSKELFEMATVMTDSFKSALDEAEKASEESKSSGNT